MKYLPENIAELILKYKTGELTGEEQSLLDEWLTIKENRNYFNETIQNKEVWDWDHEQPINSSRIWEKVNAGLHRQEAIVIKPHFNWKRMIAAASIIVAITAGGWFLWQEKFQAHTDKLPIAAELKDLAPGTNKAILTLSNGKVIDLNDAKKGQLAQESGMAIEKTADGQIAYHLKDQNPYPNKFSKAETVAMNMIATPRGGQYKIILPDQTAVWLNAASSIRFPPSFTGNTRTVEITGEAYFEVTKNASMPFIVKMKDMELTVLGTHFNVMGYGEEDAIRTTLLEGSVRVQSNQDREENSIVLKPGQQSSLDKHGKLTLAKQINADQAVAWVKGYFQFKNEDVATIMRQIARWYNVEVTYKTGIPPGKYTGKISRGTNASEVLKMLQLGGIHYTIEENRLIIQ